MQTQRIEFMFYDSGSVVCLLARGLGGLSPAAFMEHRYDLVADGIDLERDGFFMSPGLYQDDGFIMCVVLGELTAQEAHEWVARSRGRLNLIDGELIISSTYEWESADDWDTTIFPRILPAKYGGIYDTTTYIRIPPGLYSSIVYSYLPADLSASWSSITDGGVYVSRLDAIKGYFKQTCPDELLPDWLKWSNSNQNYISFVLHLIPVDKPEFDSLHITDFKTNFGWEFRRPDPCPQGIATDTLFEDAENDGKRDNS